MMQQLLAMRAATVLFTVSQLPAEAAPIDFAGRMDLESVTTPFPTPHQKYTGDINRILLTENCCPRAAKCLLGIALQVVLVKGEPDTDIPHRYLRSAEVEKGIQKSHLCGQATRADGVCASQAGLGCLVLRE